MRNLAGIAAQGYPAVEARGTEPDGTSIGAALQNHPEADVLPAVGASSVSFLERQILAPAVEIEWADGSVVLRAIE